MMEEYELKMDAVAFGGSAVGTLPDGKRCFVRGGVPGDVLKVAVTSNRKSFAKAELLEILKPSPDRIPAPCPYFGKCPGCSYQNMPYEKELFWKQNQFERFLIHGKLADPSAVQPPAGAPARLGWRNKIRFTCRDGIRGYLAEDNHSLLEIADCLLADMKIRNLAMRTPVPEKNGRITFRVSAEGAQIVPEKPDGSLLTEKVLGLSMQVPSASFFQVNPAAFELLAKEFLRLLDAAAPETFAELYCGSGTFSLLAASHGVSRVIGVELDAAAIRTAKENLKNAGLKQAEFRCGDAAVLFSAVRNLNPEKTLLLVDPPRTGLAPELCRKILASGLRRMIYVSCGPDTLARDLRLLESGANPWRIRSARLVDLFPSTAHFESITLLER